MGDLAPVTLERIAPRAVPPALAAKASPDSMLVPGILCIRLTAGQYFAMPKMQHSHKLRDWNVGFQGTLMAKKSVAPLWPTIREFIQDALEDGCELRMIDGVRCVCRDHDGQTIFVSAPEQEDDDQIRLTPSIADSHYRVLLLVEKIPVAGVSPGGET
jgi:hypothetical protein